MEWNGGKEMEWNGQCTQLQLTCVTGTVVQGCASYYVSRGLTAEATYEQVQCCQHSSFSIMMSWSELRVPGEELQYHAWGPHLLLLRKVLRL